MIARRPETRAQLTQIRARTQSISPTTDAKKMLAADGDMRRQLLDRLIELDRDKEDRVALRKILAGKLLALAR